METKGKKVSKTNKMNIYFIKSSEKKEIIEELKEQFGIEELPFLLIESGKEKIRGFTGSLSKEEIVELGKIAWIEGVGIYLFKREEALRIGFDATQILGNQITKNIIDITEEQARFWLRGRDIEMQTPRGIVVVRYQGDFFGCGKSTGEKITNHVPKERRLKK